MRTATVLSPGAWTTVQDLGRPGLAHLGVARGGAADPVSARTANRLVGNAPADAVLEMTLLGAMLRFSHATRVALAGSEFHCNLPMGSPVEIRAGHAVRIGGTLAGARVYLAVAGGFAVPPFGGSASTLAAAGLGGFEGRALRGGDVLRLGEASGESPVPSGGGLESLRSIVSRRTIRVTAGAHRSRLRPAAWELLLASEWTLREASDRAGLRLDGPVLPADVGSPMRTEGVLRGTIQVPGDGKPIILFVDHGTTGGYPKIADVIAADLPALGQLRPRDSVRFQEVSFEQAREALLEDERRIAAVLGKGA